MLKIKFLFSPYFSLISCLVRATEEMEVSVGEELVCSLCCPHISITLEGKLISTGHDISYINIPQEISVELNLK